jgi:hypothetical protein
MFAADLAEIAEKNVFCPDPDGASHERPVVLQTERVVLRSNATPWKPF